MIEKLQTFTTLYKDEENDKYYFLDNDEQWVLTYTSENEFVSFENETVVNCFTDAFGDGCFSDGSVSDLGFAYDLSDNEARIYFDVDIEDGHLTIVSYNFSEEDYELMIDGDKWDTTNEFNDFVKGYGLAESMESDVNGLESLLLQNRLSIDDLLKVEYETLDEQFVPDENENSSDEVSDKANGIVETEGIQETEVDFVRAEIIEVDYPYIYGGIMDSVIREVSDLGGDTDWLEYTYFDMDNDGYLEFFVQKGTCNADLV